MLRVKPVETKTRTPANLVPLKEQCALQLEVFASATQGMYRQLVRPLPAYFVTSHVKHAMATELPFVLNA